MHALGDPSGIAGARPAVLPRSIEPQLATLVDEPPQAAGYLHEMKLDGYRILCVVDRGRVTLLTRRGNDWTGRFSSIAREAEHLGEHRLVLDGEAVILDAHGRPDFQALQNAMGGDREDIVYYAFDLLYLDGFDLRGAALRARKEALRLLLAATPDVTAIRYSDHVQGPGRDFYEQACQAGLEGIVCKKADAPYRAGRNRHFLKVKCRKRDELVIIGYTPPGGSRVGFGALLVATREQGQPLRYAGKVGTGFSGATLRSLKARLDAIARDDPPIPTTLPPRERRRVTWVEPELVAEVAFHGFTDDGTLRQPAFMGLREDKSPADVRIEHASKSMGVPSARAPSIVRDEQSATIEGVRLTHPDRVMFPEMGLTKLALATYYASIPEVVIVGMYDRPLTLLRCPEGAHADCFYQKRPRPGVPASVPRVRVKPGTDYLAVHELADVLALVQLGVLELHIWGARADRLDRPDLMVFDLDPGPGVPWTSVVATADTLRQRLHRLELTAFCRLTGGKGLHVVVPIERYATWDEVQAFTQGVVAELVAAAPEYLTANMAKSRRKNKIFIDVFRNAPEATAIASYSVRAREGAPVAAPIGWDELADTSEVPHWSPDDVIARVSAGIDPWREFEECRARLTRAALSAVT